VRAGEKGSRAKPSQSEMPRSLAAIDLFATLNDQARQALERRCTWRRWAAGEQIIDRETTSNDVYFMVSGRARVIDYSNTGHREVIFDEIEPGGYFGELAAIDGEPRSANIVAIDETVTAALTAEAFVDVLFEHREAGMMFMRRLTEVVRQSTTRIMDLSTVGVHNRIYTELLRQARTGGGRAPNTAAIQPVPVHSDIAARVSTTRETVARVLSELTHRRLLQREQDSLILLDVKTLIELAQRFRE
jgi:CRP/FNR family transcriptional regulator, cyclic AMP receptor protein